MEKGIVINNLVDTNENVKKNKVRHKVKPLEKEITREEFDKLTEDDFDKLIEEKISSLKKIEELYKRLPLTEEEFENLTEEEQFELSLMNMIPSDFSSLKRDCFENCMIYLDLRQGNCLRLIGLYLNQAYESGKMDGNK
jgi:hypothetical protein